MKKARAYISSNFSTTGSKYSSIFFMGLTPKNDKNLDLMFKNSSLYKVELTIALPLNLIYFVYHPRRITKNINIIHLN